MEGKAVFLVVSTLLLGFSLGNPFLTPAGGLNSMEQGATPKKHCCVPDQFETYCFGLMAPEDKPKQLLQESLHFSYDAPGQRVAWRGSAYGSAGREPIKYIQLFAKKKMYFIKSDGSCVVKPLKAKFGKFCINRNPTYMGRLVAGSGRNVMQAEMWQRMRKNYYETMTVTPGNPCILVAESSYGQAGSNPEYIPMLGAVAYANTTLGIQSTDVFTPPKGCKPADDYEIPVGLMKYIANKFIESN